jgi:hypothetical protein
MRQSCRIAARRKSIMLISSFSRSLPLPVKTFTHVSVDRRVPLAEEKPRYGFHANAGLQMFAK